MRFWSPSMLKSALQIIIIIIIIIIIKIQILIINRYDSWHSLNLNRWQLEDQNLRNTTKMAPWIPEWDTLH